jgi:hypothetical protein
MAPAAAAGASAFMEVPVMSTVHQAATAAPDAPATPRTSGARRIGSALGMVIAPWGFVVTNTCYALSIRHGGNEDTSADSLALYGAHPTLARVALVAGMLGCLLLIPAVLGTFRLAPTSRLVLAGGSLMIAGYTCYFGVLATGFWTLAMAERGGPMADYAAVIDAAQEQVWTVWVFLLFVLGNLVGTALLAIGLLRERAAPVWAAVGILSWPPLHVIGLIFFGNEVPQVIGAVLQALGFAGCAVVLLLRRGSGPAAG